MDCTARAAQEILKSIENNNSNIVICPASLNFVLMNLLDSKLKESTWEQLLDFVGRKDLSKISKNFPKIMNEILPERKAEKKKKSLFGFEKLGFVDEKDFNVGFSEIKSEGPELLCFNGFSLDESVARLRSSLEGLGKIIFKAKLKSADFVNELKAESKIVKRWKKAAKELIQNGTSPMDFKFVTSMVFTNAVKDSFSLPLSKQEKFHLLNGETVEASFIISSRKKYHYGSFDDFKLLKLPHLSPNSSSLKIKDEDDEERLSVYFFLPHEKDGLQELIKKVSTNSRAALDDYFDKLEYVELESLWIPKSKLSHKSIASKVVKELGFRLPFEKRGEFSDMDDSSDWYLVQLSDMKPEEPPLPRPSFIADHPFFFLIREDVSGLILFIGSVIDPNE